MKIGSYILSFYLLLLAVVPCCTFDDCPDDKQLTDQQSNHDKGDEDDCGTCSPFFNCEGCSSVTTDLPQQLTSELLAIPKSYTGFVSPWFPVVHYDFWQPPKIG